TLFTPAENDEPTSFVKEIQIDTDLEVLFPDDYINSVSERLSLYNRLNVLKNEAELMAFQRDLEDRFGPLPLQAYDLINSVRLKWKAQGIGLERLILKRGQLSGYFIADQENAYYQSSLFSSVLQWVQLSEGKIELKEKETRQGLRLRLAIKNINTIPEALACFPNL
ncbi:transcription-repair coupling factor, partial [Flavobacteriaceae bacterium]|nr:transcription-repair coupling factor [Flavobacteriaceae bacterium]